MAKDFVVSLIAKTQSYDRNMTNSGRVTQKFATDSKSALASAKASADALITSVAKMASVAAAADLAIGLLKGNIKLVIGFEKSLSELKSITGVTTQELKFFEQQAILMGGATTQTAAQVVDAFKLIGSQAPVLLKSKEALAEVTKNAIILSEAAGIELSQAAKGVTTAINQMQMSVFDSGRIINVLAAASMAGAGDVSYLQTALEKSAAVASTFGLSLEDTVAAIEVLAPRISDASSAGNSLKNIFLTLETQTNGRFKPSVVGLSEALANLKKANLTAADSAKLFGKEHISAALALVDNVTEYDDYKTAITGTNTALEQQAINNDNLAGSIKAITSNWEALNLEVNKSSGYLKGFADRANEVISGLRAFMGSDALKLTSSIGEQLAGFAGFGVTGWLMSLRAEVKESGVDTQALMDNFQKATDKYKAQGVEEVDARKKAYEEIKAIREKEIKDYEELIKKKEAIEEGQKARGPGYGVKRMAEKAKAAALAAAGVADVSIEKLEALKAALSDFDTRAGSMLTGTVTPVVGGGGGERAPYTGINWMGIQGMREKYADYAEALRKPVTIAAPEARLPESILERLKRQADDFRAKMSEAMDPAAISKYATALAGVEKEMAGLTNLESGLDKVKKLTESIAESVRTSIVAATSTLFSGLGEAIGGGGMESFNKMLIGLMDTLISLGSAFIAAGISSDAFKKSLLSNPIAAIAAGAALVATATSAKMALTKATNFADGGIVYGETFARVGEYPGASSNPEVIAPLNKLKGLISEGGSGGRVEFVIKGDTLQGVLNNNNRKRSRG